MNSTNSITDRLDADFASSWKPERGNILTGEVVALGERQNDFGAYPIITVKQADGQELAFHAFHSVARKRLAEQRPVVGSQIAVRYEGLVTGGARDYNDYRIVVEHPDGASLDWARFADSKGESDGIPF